MSESEYLLYRLGHKSGTHTKPKTFEMAGLHTWSAPHFLFPAITMIRSSVQRPTVSESYALFVTKRTLSLHLSVRFNSSFNNDILSMASPHPLPLQTTFQLTLLIDALTYTFHHTSGTGKSSIYTRSDNADVKIVFDAKFGWSTWNEETGSLTGRVWDVVQEEQRNEPTEGVWVSRKRSKSYVYQMRWVDRKEEGE